MVDNVVDNPTFSDAVEGAVEVIREYGWTRETYGNPEIGYCVLGALEQWQEMEWRKNPEGYDHRFLTGVENVVASYLPNPGVKDKRVIPFWNDNTAKDRVEVEEKLMEIAKDLRNQGK